MEKKLEILKKALEMGAKIEISFFRNESLEEAKLKADAIAEGLGLKTQYSSTDEEEILYERYITDTYRSQINVSSYFNTEKERSA